MVESAPRPGESCYFPTIAGMLKPPRLELAMSALAPSTVLTVKRCTPALGAEIAGVNLERDINDETFLRIRQVLDEHSVIVFRGGNLPPQRQVDFTRRLGALKATPLLDDYALPGFPDIMRVSNIRENGKHIGNPDAGVFWHSDGAYQERPAMYSLLYAIEVPARNGSTVGDTYYASTAAAYDALPAARQTELSKLTAAHSLSHQYEKKKSAGMLRRGDMTKDEKTSVVPPVRHPLVRTHPRTGRKCIYVNEGHTVRVEGLPDAESRALLDELFAWCVRPEFVYRHNWQPGDFVIWDNCATLHRATFDYELPQRRLMHRTTVLGNVPV